MTRAPPRRRAWTLAALLLVAPARADALPPGDAAAGLEEARRLFREGARLARDARWEEAIERLERSHALRPSPITRYSLGVAQLRAERWLAAQESFTEFLRAPVTPRTQALLEPARAALSQLDLRLVRLRLHVAPDSAPELVLTIDGKVLPPASLGAPVRVLPGLRQVTARARGFRERTLYVIAPRGELLEVELALERAPSLARRDRTVATRTRPAEPEPGRGRTLGFALAGAGGAALTAGVVVGLLGIRAAAVAPSRDGEEAETARALGVWGDGLGVAGVVALGAGLVTLHLTVPPDRATGAPPRPRAAAQLGVAF